MAIMTISLPESMRDWIEMRVVAKPYTSASDYIRSLIRRDQERVSNLAELQGLITEGLDSGVSDRSTAEVLEAAREQTTG